MSPASQFLFALPAPWCGARGTSQRRVPAPTADLPPRSCNSFRPSTFAQPSRLPIPVRSRQGNLGIQHSERPSQLLLLRSRAPPGCTPVGYVPTQPGFKPEVFCSARILPVPKLHPSSYLPRHGRPAHPPRAPVLSPNRRGPSLPPTRISSPKTAAPQHSYSCHNQPAQPQPFLRGLPGGMHSTVVAGPSPPPTTVRHAPPDVETFFTTSLLPKDCASVAIPRQPPEGKHHSLSKPNTVFL